MWRGLNSDFKRSAVAIHRVRFLHYRLPKGWGKEGEHQVSVKQVSVDGRLFYTYSGKKCKDVYSPAEIKDSEELEKAIDLMMSLEEDDRKAMDFLVAVQSTVDKYSKENNVTIREIGRAHV